MLQSMPARAMLHHAGMVLLRHAGFSLQVQFTATAYSRRVATRTGGGSQAACASMLFFSKGHACFTG